MAIQTRPLPDDFQSPEAHAAAGKSTVSRVLSRVAEGGNSLLSLLSGLLAAVMILYSGYVLYDTFYTQNTAAAVPYDLLQYRPEIIEDGASPLAGAETLAAVNEDYRAWLTMHGSNIDYPVMQGEDNLYYANHDVYGNTSLTGSVYLATENSGRFTESYNLIYGHHMGNGAMFGALDAYMSESYFNANREGVLVTSSGVFDLRTFAVITTDAYEGAIYTVGDRMDAVLSFLRARKAAPDGKTSVLFLDEEALAGADKILALSTCADAETNGRLAVFATMTRRNLITMDVSDYDGVYDAQAHGPQQLSVNYPSGTTFAYSTDGGATWIDGLPAVTDVGETNVLLRADHPDYGTVTKSVKLKVSPRPITVRPADQFKVFGSADPAWEIVPVTGIVDDFVPQYTVRRTNTAEAVGVYSGALVAEGERLQGNYEITFLPGDFSITPADTLALLVDGYTGVYDAAPHGLARVTVNVTNGTTIEYSTDGGATWTQTAPELRAAGRLQVLIRATNPNYATATATALLRIDPAAVTVRALDAQKTAGEDDPVFSATVIGLLDNAAIRYELTRPSAGTDEAAGTYENAIVPVGEEYQGNYRVVFEAGDFTIEAAEETIEESAPPLAQFVEQLEPTPVKNTRVWALVNLICALISLYVVLPFAHLKDKFGRIKAMRQANEDAAGEDVPYDHLDRFVKRFRVGLVLEVLTFAATVVAFVLTEDMSCPMVLIDKWTPLFLLLLALTFVEDLRLTRYHGERKEEKESETTSAKF